MHLHSPHQATSHASRSRSSSHAAAATRLHAPRSRTPTAVRAALPVAELALAATAVSAGTTFFVLPRFMDKGPDWSKTVLPALRAEGVRTIAPSEAARGRKLILDVRLPERFEQTAAQGSVNVPLFIPIQKWDAPSIVRRLGFAFFGVPGTELNPNFVAQAQAAIKGRGEVVVMCETGGSIEARAGNDKGFQSQSMKAIYYLSQAGVRVKASVVEGGLSRWRREGLPMVDDEE